MISVFVNNPRDQGLIPGRVIPKTQKMDASWLKNYKVGIKGKWSNPGNLVMPVSTPQCSTY